VHLDITDHDGSHVLFSSNNRGRNVKGKEVCELCTDCKDYDTVGRDVLSGASAKLRKASTFFFCLSLRME